jgi:hypothetical protein
VNIQCDIGTEVPEISSTSFRHSCSGTPKESDKKRKKKREKKKRRERESEVVEPHILLGCVVYRVQRLSSGYTVINYRPAI